MDLPSQSTQFVPTHINLQDGSSVINPLLQAPPEAISWLTQAGMTLAPKGLFDYSLGSSVHFGSAIPSSQRTCTTPLVAIARLAAAAAAAASAEVLPPRCPCGALPPPTGSCPFCGAYSSYHCCSDCVYDLQKPDLQVVVAIDASKKLDILDGLIEGLSTFKRVSVALVSLSGITMLDLKGLGKLVTYPILEGENAEIDTTKYSFDVNTANLAMLQSMLELVPLEPGHARAVHLQQLAGRGRLVAVMHASAFVGAVPPLVAPYDVIICGSTSAKVRPEVVKAFGQTLSTGNENRVISCTESDLSDVLYDLLTTPHVISSILRMQGIQPLSLHVFWDALGRFTGLWSDNLEYNELLPDSIFSQLATTFILGNSLFLHCTQGTLPTGSTLPPDPLPTCLVLPRALIAVHEPPFCAPHVRSAAASLAVRVGGGVLAAPKSLYALPVLALLAEVLERAGVDSRVELTEMVVLDVSLKAIERSLMLVNASQR